MRRERRLVDVLLVEEETAWILHAAIDDVAAAFRAVRAGRVYVAEDYIHFNRSSPSVFDTIDLLAEILHPGRFPRRFEDREFARGSLEGAVFSIGRRHAY